MPLPLVAAGISALPSLFKGISGLFGSSKANRLERQNVRPQYTIPDEFKQNLAIAENMGRVGLPEQQYMNALNNINRNQSGALRTLSRSANPAAGLASIVRSGNNATMGLDAADAQARNSNQRLAMQQRGVLGQQQLAKQQWDKFDKYNQNAQAIAAMRGAAQQNTFGALNDLSQIGILGATGAFGGGGNMGAQFQMPSQNPVQPNGVFSYGAMGLPYYGAMTTPQR